MDWNQWNTYFGEEYLGLLIPLKQVIQAVEAPEKVIPIDEGHAIYYYEREELPELSISTYSYSVIPKCFSLLGEKEMARSGIERTQNTLGLTGKDVLVAIIDTGIDWNASFLTKEDGQSRVAAYWDQTGGDGNDENGHGTFLSGLVAEAAPEAELLVVKLHPANEYLKDFYYIPSQTPCFSEDCIMAGIAFCVAYAKENKRPIVICLGLGTNNGSHSGSSILSEYLNNVAETWGQCVVIATGNEANKRHHFYGMSPMNSVEPVEAEINVSNRMGGFYCELWANAPDLFYVAVKSPSGKAYSTNYYVEETHQEYFYPIEDTVVSVDYRSVGRTKGDQLIFIRFMNPKEGIWKIQVYPGTIFQGSFHMWLPMEAQQLGEVYFIQSNPDVTLTTPSSAQQPIAVGGYQAGTDAIYVDSGRGYTADGRIKPDFVAPALEVAGIWLDNEPWSYTGTSAAAAITAGACALYMEWGVVQGNKSYLNSVELGNILARGSNRKSNEIYPNRMWGYGSLNLYDSF